MFQSFRVPTVLVLALVVAACSEKTTDTGCGSGASATTNPWPPSKCPSSSTTTVKMRLDDIIAKASGVSYPEAAAAKLKAEACLMHKKVTAAHCAKLYSAHSAAQTAVKPGLSDAQRKILWAMCAGELTHGDGGGVSLSGGTPGGCGGSTWLTSECPPGLGMTVTDRLDDIEGWANADKATVPVAAGALPRVAACRSHTAVTALHCDRVYAAFKYAEKAHAATQTEQKEILWVACIGELTHGDGGGEPAGG